MALFGIGKQYATGIEIGTSKICVVVAEVSKEHPFRILSIGQSPSHGVRKGSICKEEYTLDDLRAAVSDAENAANVVIGDVCVGITGSHVHSVNTNGIQYVEGENSIIAQEDKIDVLKNAEECLPDEIKNKNYILNKIRQPYILDGITVYDDPEGMYCSELVLPIHWVYSASKRKVDNILRLLRDMYLEPKNYIFTGFAMALAMDREQKKRGGLIIDLGAGTTEYVFVQRGYIRHAGVLTIGGDHVSNDLALGLKLEIGVAENLKVSCGRAKRDSAANAAMLPYVSRNGERKEVRLDHFQLIMESRLREIFQVIHTKLAEVNLKLNGDQTVILCGGGACIQLINELAENVFQVKAVPYKLEPFEGICESVKAPQFATAIGLAQYRAAKLVSSKKGPLSNIFNRNELKRGENDD